MRWLCVCAGSVYVMAVCLCVVYAMDVNFRSVM
jgi:hypothetical protein